LQFKIVFIGSSKEGSDKGVHCEFETEKDFVVLTGWKMTDLPSFFSVLI
jgi:hypothetical protein